MGKTAIKLLFVNHSQDHLTLQRLKEHLYFPIKNRIIALVPDYQISEAALDLTKAQQTADLIIPLVSPSLLKQYYKIKSFSPQAPILIAPSKWEDQIVDASMLPLNQQPVTSWKLIDEALLTVVKELLEIVSTIEPRNNHTTTSTLSALEREGLEGEQTILTEKLSYLRKSAASMSEGSKKFELMMDIEQLEAQMKEIQLKLRS